MSRKHAPSYRLGYRITATRESNEREWLAFPLLRLSAWGGGAARGFSARSPRIIYSTSAPPSLTLLLLFASAQVPCTVRAWRGHSDSDRHPTHTRWPADVQSNAHIERSTRILIFSCCRIRGLRDWWAPPFHKLMRVANGRITLINKYSLWYPTHVVTSAADTCKATPPQRLSSWEYPFRPLVSPRIQKPLIYPSILLAEVTGQNIFVGLIGLY